MTARELFRADLERYLAHYDRPPTGYRRLQIIMQTEGIWAIWWYRFGCYLRHEAPSPIRFAFKFPFLLAEKWIGHVTGIHLYSSTSIGPGFYIGHYGGIWISPLAKIGANCSIAQGVTIGTASRDRGHAPELADRVWVGPNAVITGAAKIASGAVVAANTLVASNIPENGVAIGVPARVISYTGSASLIVLPKVKTPVTE
jgi:serine O-acetyltransferase